MKKPTVAVFFGGKSPEHEISIITGVQVVENIDRDEYEVIPVYVDREGQLFIGDNLGKIETYRDLDRVRELATPVRSENFAGQPALTNKHKAIFGKQKLKQIDVVFNAFHGGLGEGGGYQGLFEVMDVPHVGSGIVGSAIGMDKVIMKQLFRQMDIPVANYQAYLKSEFTKGPDEIIGKIESSLSYPLFVKPARGGSSIGTTKAKSTAELRNALEVAFAYDFQVIVEESFEDAKEINVSVLGSYTRPDEIQFSVLEEVYSTADMLDFENKYIAPNAGKSSGMASTDRKIPAEISEDLQREVKKYAKDIFVGLKNSGVVRTDFLVRPETGEMIAIETNTFPGSASFYLWEPAGVSFKELTDRMIQIAIDEHALKQSVSHVFQTDILKDFKLGGTKKLG